MFLTNILFALTPVMILFGPPGSGKGTFSQYLKEHYDYNHLSIGDLLRNEISSQSEFGREIEETIKNGEYIDPKLIHAILAEQVKGFKRQNTPFILDGFGQNREDATFMERLLKDLNLFDQTMIVYLKADNATCCDRIKERKVCSSCGHVYNTLTMTPTLDHQCDVCGGELKQRINDQKEVTANRLKRHRDHIEENYKEALFIFPTIIYDANAPMQELYRFCDRIAQGADIYQGTSQAFAEDFR